MAKFNIQASLRFDLKVEVTVSSLRHEEKLKTAVLMDRGEGSGILSTNVLFYRTQMDISIAVIITELTEGPNTAIWFPAPFHKLQPDRLFPLKFFPSWNLAKENKVTPTVRPVLQITQGSRDNRRRFWLYCPQAQ